MVGRILAATALIVLGATVVQASSLPNDYTVARTWTYDQNTGQAGTLHLSYQFTGTTHLPPQSPMCTSNQATHTPKIIVNMVVNGTTTATSNVAGTGVLPCSQMNQTLDVSFDLFSDQCTLDLLASGGCELDEQQEVYCTIAGPFVIIIPKVQIELANTTSQVLWNTKGINGQGVTFYNAQADCVTGTPPDFPGPDVVFQGKDPIQTGLVRTQDFCARAVLQGESFNGIPWVCFNVPRNGYTSYVSMKADNNPPTFACTNKDQGQNPAY